MRIHAGLACVVLLACPFTPCLAVTIHVPADQPTIQAGIDAAAAGDTVLVAPGTYNEVLTMKSGVVLTSETGAPATIIDAAFAGSVISCTAVSDATIEGFTLSRGAGSVHDTYRAGGGILCVGSSPTIRANVIVDCTIRAQGTEGTLAGGGIACLSGSMPLIDECDLGDNRLEQGLPNTLGGGIFCDASSPAIVRHSVLRDNFSGNGGAGGADSRTSGLLIEDCSFEHNYGGEAGGFMGAGTVRRSRFHSNWGGEVLSAGGIVAIGGMEIIDCLLIGNGSWLGAGYYGGAKIESGAATLHGNTIVGNYAVMGAGVGRLASEPMVMERNIVAENGNGAAGYGVTGYRPGVDDVRCNDVWHNAEGEYYPLYPVGQGNFSADPLFCDPQAGDYTLNRDSPCAPAHQPECGLIGALDVGCGATAVEPSTWGSLKQRFELPGR